MEILVDIGSSCSDPALGAILIAIRNILNLIGIIAPILLIIMASLHLFQMMRDPDNKKLVPKIKNSFIAAAVIFFIPTFVNIVMALLGSSTTISECWNSAKATNSTTYMEIGSKKKNKIGNDPSDYEKGEEKIGDYDEEEEDGSGIDSTIDGTAKQIGDVIWDPTDVTRISNLTTSQLIAVLNAHGGKAKNFIPYASSLITTEHKYSVNVFFLLGIQALESGWATSKISRNCNNLGGVRESKAHPSNGCGSNKGGGFAYFSTVAEFNDYQGYLLHNKYLTPGASHYHGKTPAGVVVDYCHGSQSWVSQVTSIANSLFKDVAKVL